MAVKKSVLRRFSFFRALKDRELAALALQLNEAHYSAHATIFSDKEPGDCFYLLQTGSVEISKLTADGEILLNVLQPGDHFGEMSLLDDQPRSATARATTDLTVIQIPKAIFLSLVTRFPILLHQTARISDERLRQRDQDLIQELTTHNQQLERLYETSLDISRHREIDPLLAAIIERAAALFDSTAGQLYLFDEKIQRLVSPKGKAIQLNAGATGRAFATGAPMIHNKIGRQNPSRELAAPICLDSKSLGVISVCRNKGSAPFIPEDAKLLRLFANQAAIAIENARLYGLAVEKAQFDGELHAAYQVQHGLIPPRAPRLAGFHLAGMWRPAREVSGDFYDFIPLEKSRWGIVIADVSDKGLPAALFMVLTRSILRANLVAEPDLARAIARANRVLCADAHDGMFVTVLVGILDARSRRFTYVNAGHNPPLLWRAHAHRLVALKRHGWALGIEASAAFTAQQVELKPGDRLVLYIDGVTDAVNAQDRFFSEARLAQLVKLNAHRSAGDLVRALDRAICEFVGVRALSDDATAVVLATDS